MNRPAKRIDSVMTRTPQVIGADETLETAHHAMRTHRVRHLPVMQGGELVGVLTERDVYWFENLQRAEPSALRVADAMTPFPYFVGPDAPLDKVAREMADAKYGCAVVLDGNHPVGVFTVTDALLLLADTLAHDRGHAA